MKRNDKHLVAKEIHVLHVAFSFSSFKCSPMLSMLLSAEELESLIILEVLLPCVWKSSSLLSLCCSVVSQLLFIIIKPWIQHFLILTSPTFLSFLSLPHLPQIFFYFHDRKIIEPPLQIEVHEITFPTSHHSHEMGSKKESCVYFTLAMQSVPSIFRTPFTKCLCYLFLYRSSKLMILDVLERRLEGASEY
jgi:hypothetical protein